MNHGRHHSAALLTQFTAVALATSLLAGCALFDTPPDQIDWSAQWDLMKQPGPLGALFDRKPPPTWIRASGPYPGPLSDATTPVISPDLAAAIVAAPFRDGLSPEARMNLAQASMLAASAATGTTIAWSAADAGGAVVPARDVYLSHRGNVCRDVQQQLKTPSGTEAAQVTLCRDDLGNSNLLWVPGTAD